MRELLEKIVEDRMKVDYKYIFFRIIEEKPKTKVWSCYSKHDIKLGEVRWFSRWRQYCYFPETNTVYSKGCLEDITNFIRQMK